MLKELKKHGHNEGKKDVKRKLGINIWSKIRNYCMA